MTATKPNWRSILAVSVMLLLVVLVQANQCPGIDSAKKGVRPFVEEVLAETVNKGRNWRLHWMRVDPGTTVSSMDVMGNGDMETYSCRGRCVLFFLDLDPYAHYAHPTRILVFDSKPEDRRSPFTVFRPTEWWPTVIEASWPYPKSVFSTVAETDEVGHILHLGRTPGELPVPISTSDLTVTASAISGFGSTPSGGFGGVVPLPIPTPAPGSAGLPLTIACDSDAEPVWAILVDGFNDVGNSFDEDVSGMYSVLRAFEVPEERIKVLSPISLAGVPTPISASKDALWETFESVKDLMQSCQGRLGGKVPHFLLFWSSHGTDETLFCNLADGSQDDVAACELKKRLEDLEGIWKADDASPTELVVTIVIEACKSGSVGRVLFDDGAGQRQILTSAGEWGPSYRDIDEPLDSPAGTKVLDPNPADAGSETIWGYIEAYGTQSSRTLGSAFLTFKEAAEYAMKQDLTFLAENPLFPREIGLFPDPAKSIPVHGAWNTSGRVSSVVSFSEPSSTVANAPGGPVKVVVTRGETATLEINVANSGSMDEKGALAIRLFRNEESAPGNWDAVYYPDPGIIRTTTMVPGIAGGSSFLAEYEVRIPNSLQVGKEIRLVAKLDSGQPTPPLVQGSPAAFVEPRAEIMLVVAEGKEEGGFWEWLKTLFKEVFS